MAKAELTILNSMASADFEESMRLHREWGLTWVDLRGLCKTGAHISGQVVLRSGKQGA